MSDILLPFYFYIIIICINIFYKNNKHQNNNNNHDDDDEEEKAILYTMHGSPSSIQMLRVFYCFSKIQFQLTFFCQTFVRNCYEKYIFLQYDVCVYFNKIKITNKKPLTRACHVLTLTFCCVVYCVSRIGSSLYASSHQKFIEFHVIHIIYVLYMWNILCIFNAFFLIICVFSVSLQFVTQA